MMPPRVWEGLLRRMIPPDDREVVLDELAELYRHRVGRTDRDEARRWYRRQVRHFAWRLMLEGRRRGIASGRSAFAAALDERDRREVGMRMNEVSGEVRKAIRRLSRAPVFTLVSATTVGLGIGAFAAIFSLADGVLFEEMPYEAPDELVWVWRDYVEADFPRGWLGGPDIVEMEARAEVFSGVVAVRSGSVNVSGPDGSRPAQMGAHFVGDGFFELLGVAPMIGRPFDTAENLPGSAPSVVLSHAAWRDSFGSDSGILGRSIPIDGESAEIVGVMPPDFHFVKHSSLGAPVRGELYLPLRNDVGGQSPGSGMYAGLARVRPETSDDRLRAALDASAGPVNDFMAGVGASPVRLWTVGLKDDLVAEARPAILALTGAALFLLLILAANLTTLFLGRAATRQRETGVLLALGAGRGRVMLGMLAESSLIGIVGGILGVAFAFVGVDLVVSFAPEDLPRIGSVGIDGSTLLVATVTATGMALLAGLAPALFSVHSDPGLALKEADGRSGGSRRGTRVRSGLVAVQLALSLVLLVGSGLVIGAFSALLSDDPGFDAGSTLTFRVPLSESLYPEATEQRAFHDALRERLSALPGVEAVGATTALPLTTETNQRGITFPDSPANTGDPTNDSPLIDWFRVTPGYFEAAGFRIIEGRSFRLADADTSSYHVIIDDVLAARYFPGGSAIGARAEIFGLDATVVGVVDQARLYNVHSDDRGQVYVPYQAFPVEALSYAVRADGDPTPLAAVVGSVVREADPSVPVSDVRTLVEIVGASLGQQRLSLTLIVAFALAALLLASLGVYGVVSNAVTRRSREIGIRMALGASGDEVVRLILRQGLRLAVLGATLGLVGALALSGVVERVMFGVQPRDPLAYVSAATGLVAVVVFASWVPARRATRIDPIETLGAE